MSLSLKCNEHTFDGRGNLPNAERQMPNAERRTQNAERLSVSGLSCKTCAIWYEIGSVDNHGRRANSYFEQGIKSCTTQLFQDTSHYIPLLWSLVYLVNNICHSVFVSAMNREVQVNTSHTNAFT